MAKEDTGLRIIFGTPVSAPVYQQLWRVILAFLVIIVLALGRTTWIDLTAHLLIGQSQ